MSIELTGPQGYDYQYTLTIFLALLMWEHDGLELIVEKKDGEDAELHFVFDRKTFTIETQVKSEQGTLGISSLVRWVGHFPGNQDTANLLHRVENDPNRLVLFITRSRCSDDTQTFLNAIGDILEHPESPLQGILFDTFLEAYSKTYKTTKPSPLKQRRDVYCIQHTQQLRVKKSVLRELSRRILIWERTDAESIEAELIRLLKIHHHIPEHKARAVIGYLEKAVREARNERKDVIPLMRDILYKDAGNRAFARPIHVPSEGGDLLLRDLETHHALLLTGISLCGKSHMAEWIAELYRADQGYTYLKEVELDSAYRYLTVASSESRICFLEDPFGYTSLNQESRNAWSRLYTLIEQLGPHRKLIVTSRKDLLQQLNGNPSQTTWSVGASKWRDLTVDNSAYAIKVWSKYAKLQQLPDSIRDIVAAGMDVEPTAVLQPGQIRHLAFIEPHELINKSYAELSSLAKFDAVHLGQVFLSWQENEVVLLVTMVLGSSVSFGIVERDLFALLNFVYDKSGLPEGIAQAQTVCEKLESAGYIIYVDDRLMFSHPTYYEAAMHTALTQGRYGKKRLLDILRQLLDSESVSIMLSCIRSFGRIYEAYQEKEFHSELRRMALQSLSSPYPNIRDEALVLLTTQIEELQDNEAETVTSYIKDYRFIDYNFKWHDGIPKFEDTQDNRYLPIDNVAITEEMFYTIAERLRSPEEASKVTPEEAWQLARVVDDYSLDAEIKLIILKQLLTYKEAFIREPAAFSLLSGYGENPLHVDLILGDPHPFVVLQGIQGCFQGWSSWARDTRERVRTRLQEVLTVKINCVAVNDFMIKFTQKRDWFRLDYEHMSSQNKEEILHLWSTLLPIFLEYVPPQFLEIDEGYLFESTSKAASLFSEDQVVHITEAWISWIERMITYRSPSDYGMGFLDFLLKHTTGSILYRESLAVRLLGNRDSYVVSMSLAEYINYWPRLHPQEQVQVLTVLQSDRIDARWLKAIALTRDEVPLEICRLLLGEPEGLTLPLAATEIINLTDSGLLTDAIEVYGREYGELYKLLGNTSNTLWPSIALELLKRPWHPAFPAALSYALRRVINITEMSFKDQVLDACDDLLTNGPKNVVTLMTDHMLRWTVLVNGADSQSLWELLYDHLDELETVEVTAKLVEVIDCISQNCDIPVDLLGNRAYTLLRELHLPSDNMIFFLKEIDCFITDGIASSLDMLFELAPPRVIYSYKIVQAQFRQRKDEGVPALLSKMEMLQKQLHSIVTEKKKAFYQQKPMEGWIELWKEQNAGEQSY
ncbi:hypothetical protein H1230_16445 [Paenibacillus sp. 19GGS1-52]|uniref:nSTAND3 domain-containing NTPase n=1 Tax=Paenibacillus sp. 19GGS1-52 TaxID=2758563 RepID=UPI001EFB14C6|nr:hypothetical protein [Paenibacillus sp. 19GGS1-52]ULO04753.1 hypothetical protein H1230_16445 [Paenibacillus sp. 19GGS1-52]